MRFLQRLRNDVAGRHGKEFALEARIGRHRHHVGGLLGRLRPHQFLLVRVDVEALQLGARGGRPGAPLAAARRHEVEHRDPFRHPRRRIVGWRRKHDRMADMDLPGAPGRGGEEHLGGGVVRILLQEVVFVSPDVVKAEPIGGLDLDKRVLDQTVLGFLRPGAGQLQLIDQAEPHGGRLLALCLSSRPMRSGSWPELPAYLGRSADRPWVRLSLLGAGPWSARPAFSSSRLQGSSDQPVNQHPSASTPNYTTVMRPHSRSLSSAHVHDAAWRHRRHVSRRTHSPGSLDARPAQSRRWRAAWP